MYRILEVDVPDWRVTACPLLRKEIKRAVYAALYYNETLLQTLIDEEGCSTIFTTLKGF